MIHSILNNDKRKRGGLIADWRFQARWAISTSLAIIPACVAAIAVIGFLIFQITRITDDGLGPAAARQVLRLSQYSGIYFVALMVILVSASFYLTLRISNQIIGPVRRLERHLQQVLEGKSGVRTVLRKGDYLENLAQLLNQLSTQRETAAPPAAPSEERKLSA